MLRMHGPLHSSRSITCRQSCRCAGWALHYSIILKSQRSYKFAYLFLKHFDHSGIEVFADLEELSLENTEVFDLRPLTGLKKLRSANLIGTRVEGEGFAGKNPE